MAWNRVWAEAETPPNPAAPSLAFTEPERAWIAAHPVIRVGHDPTYAPYSFPDGKGNIIGIDPDFLALIAKRTGQQFKNEVRRDWSAMLAAFTVRVKIGIGSPGALRPGTDSSRARSTTLPSASKASTRAGVPVDPHIARVTDETGLGKVARTGIGSVAIAQTIPLWPEARWG